MEEGMPISIIALKAVDRHVDALHIWADSMTVYSWITNPALRTERFVTLCINHIIEHQQKINALQHHNVYTIDNPADVALHGIDLKCDYEQIDLWLHGTELPGNPD